MHLNPAKGTVDLIGNKTIDKISKNLQQSNSETITSEYDKEISKGIHISPVKRQKTIENLRLI